MKYFFAFLTIITFLNISADGNTSFWKSGGELFSSEQAVLGTPTPPQKKQSFWSKWKDKRSASRDERIASGKANFFDKRYMKKKGITSGENSQTSSEELVEQTPQTSGEEFDQSQSSPIVPYNPENPNPQPLNQNSYSCQTTCRAPAACQLDFGGYEFCKEQCGGEGAINFDQCLSGLGWNIVTDQFQKKMSLTPDQNDLNQTGQDFNNSSGHDYSSLLPQSSHQPSQQENSFYQSHQGWQDSTPYQQPQGGGYNQPYSQQNNWQGHSYQQSNGW